jgi:hypothetical protein
MASRPSASVDVVTQPRPTLRLAWTDGAPWSRDHRAYLLRVAAFLESRSRGATWRVGVDCDAGMVWLEVGGDEAVLDRAVKLLKEAAARINERLAADSDD